MATRATIRDAFMAELTAVSGDYDVTDEDGNVLDTVTLDAADIGLRSPESVESLPQIVYYEEYRPIEYNGVGAGPDMVVYNDDGSVAEEQWREYMEAQFIIDVRASNEGAKEPIYEALRTQFGRYNHDPWPVTDFHDDVKEITVHDSTDADTGDSEDVIRGDQIEVRLVFHRTYPFSTDNIETVTHEADSNFDDTVDTTYQTT